MRPAFTAALAAALIAVLAAPACALERTRGGWLRDGRPARRAAAPLAAPAARSLLDVLRSRLAPGVELVERAPDGAPHRVFDQRVRGRRVVNGTLTLSGGDRAPLVVGTPVTASPDAALDAPPRVDAARARALALAHVRVRRAARPVAVEPVAFDGGHALRAAWHVAVASADPPLDARITVDAATGAILHADDLACALSGQASVYRTHPLDGPPAVERIDHLDGGRLSGAHVAVENAAGMSASAADLRFVYPPASPHLDEANVYYHLDRVHSFVRDTLGYAGLDEPLAAAVHYGENLDNAYYVPWGHYIVFGDGGRYNVLSRDATVAYHEYTHALTNRVAGLGSVGAAAALSEGYSDYVAATLTGDPRIAVWTVAKIGKPYLRTCANDLHAPEDLENESHHDSQLWSGLLWDLRGRLGAALTDQLAYRALYSLNAEASFADGVRALLAADREFHDGAHQDTIRTAAAARGLVP